MVNRDFKAAPQTVKDVVVGGLVSEPESVYRKNYVFQLTGSHSKQLLVLRPLRSLLQHSVKVILLVGGGAEPGKSSWVQQEDQNMEGSLDIVSARCSVALALVFWCEDKVALELEKLKLWHVLVTDEVLPIASESKVDQVDLVRVMSSDQNVL